MKKVATIVLAASLLVGCETYEHRVAGTATKVSSTMDMPDTEKTTEQKLKDEVAKDPESPRSWMLLGDYYERRFDYERAADAYEHMAALVEKLGQLRSTKYTGGHYMLGKIYALMGRYDYAIGHLQAVLAMQQKDLKLDALNPHFAESNFLLGSIHHIHRQWRDAKKHFEAYVVLCGDSPASRARVDPWMAEIKREID